MENIDQLLENLDSRPEENNFDVIDDLLQSLDASQAENKEDLTSTEDVINTANDSVLKKSREETKYNFDEMKKEASSKYNDFESTIREHLKENRQSKIESSHVSSWNVKKNTKEKSNTLSVTSSATSTAKNDVYAEPIFGLRLVNPLVSSSYIQSKMTGRHPVAVSNIFNHLKCGDKNTDWVFAGAIVFKSGLKTSQKGKQYCLWKISDLKQDLKQVTLYLFGNACTDLWKVSIGTVAAVLNAALFYKDEKASKDEVTLTVRNADQVMIWGGSRDYGICRAKKKNGENCNAFVNKSQCEFCIYHVQNEYKKFAASRSNLQAPSIGLANLRNKVLGKSEVFYGGKTYTAINVPKGKSGKLEKRDNFRMNQLSLNTAKANVKQREADSERLEKLNASNNISVTSQNENFERITSLHNSNTETMVKKTEKLNRQNIGKSLINIDLKTTKPILSRLHLIKKAGERMLETGKITRVTSTDPTEKKVCASFAEVLGSDVPTSETPKSSVSINFEASSKRKITLDKSQAVIEFSLDAPPLKSAPLKSNPLRKVTLDRSQATIEFSFDKESSKLSSAVSNKESNSLVTKSPVIFNNGKRKSDSIDSSLNIKSSKFLNDFKDLQHSSAENTQSSNSNEIPAEPENAAASISDAPVIKNDNTFKSRTLLQSRCSPQNSIHKRRKVRDKMNAINVIKSKGGLTKSNPNQIKSDPQKRKSLKMATEGDGIEETEESFEKSVLSPRFVELMNAQSKHENLVQLAEDIARQEYFNKMEKKEQLEEKMLATYKVPCKAVMCLKCKYKWFSASDLCKAESHPLKVIDTVKRFFKCDNCSNRTVTLEIVPLISCKTCGGSKWSRTGMIRDKLAKCDGGLSIRGDEVKFLDSLSHNMNINLLVPMDQ